MAQLGENGWALGSHSRQEPDHCGKTSVLLPAPRPPPPAPSTLLLPPLEDRNTRTHTHSPTHTCPATRRWHSRGQGRPETRRAMSGVRGAGDPRSSAGSPARTRHPPAPGTRRGPSAPLAPSHSPR